MRGQISSEIWPGVCPEAAPVDVWLVFELVGDAADVLVEEAIVDFFHLSTTKSTMVWLYFPM